MTVAPPPPPPPPPPAITPIKDVQTRPVAIADLFFIVNQQAVASQLLMSAISSLMVGEREKCSAQLAAAFEAHEKLGRRIDALLETGHANVE